MKKILIIISILFSTINLVAQSQEGLYFTRPQTLPSKAASDRAPAIVAVSDDHFLTGWKQNDPSGDIQVANLKNNYDQIETGDSWAIDDANALSNPDFLQFQNKTYAFWIDKSFNLSYTEIDDKTHKQIIRIPLGIQSNDKMSIETMGNALMLTVTLAKSNDIMYATLRPNGEAFSMEKLQPLNKKAKTDGNATLISKKDGVTLIWSSHDKKQIVFSSYDSHTQLWGKIQEKKGQYSSLSPSGVRLSDQTGLYILKGMKSDNNLYYVHADEQGSFSTPIALPPYLSTNHELTIAPLKRDEKFIMIYTDNSGQVSYSVLMKYRAENWMEATLFPSMEDMTLKDIVIPGSHDAGMSILNGVGGQKSGTINECNTLTQSMNIENQLKQGLRMFDLRVGVLNNKIYLKHSSSDCMADAIGGGYGEKLIDVLNATKSFVEANNSEFIIFTFSHFCPKELPIEDLAKFLVEGLGESNIVNAVDKNLATLKLKDLKGKILLLFEGAVPSGFPIMTNTMTDQSNAPVNIKRSYAATNNLQKLLVAEKSLFEGLKTAKNNNDWIRLDWQLTQSPQEAAEVCNSFQKEGANPIMDGVILLSNMIGKTKSIIDLAKLGNAELPASLYRWIDEKVIVEDNKPNIIYVDNAGVWVTNLCVQLNKKALYHRADQ